MQTLYGAGGYNQPICSSSPRIRGENNIMFETTTQIYITTSWKSGENSLLNCIYLVFGDVSWDRLCVYTKIDKLTG